VARHKQRRAIDPHWHLRDKYGVIQTLTAIAGEQFQVIFAEPNTTEPILNAHRLIGYRTIINHARPKGLAVGLLIQLTERTTARTVYEAKEAGAVAAKIYFYGTTTNSINGVKDPRKLDEALTACEKVRLPVQVHGEPPCIAQPKSEEIIRLGCLGDFKGINPDNVASMERVREFVRIDDCHGMRNGIMHDIVTSFPKLPISLEHISTIDEVEYVNHAPPNVMAGIAPHYMLMSQDDLFDGGVVPAIACKPVYKTAADVRAVLDAALSGNPQFGLASDTAYHDIKKKSNPCGCSAGNFTGMVLMRSLVQIFAAYGKLDLLEPFTTTNYARHYDIELSDETLELEEKPFDVPATLPVGDETGVVWLGGKTLDWDIVR
jgi:dihydroorotase